MRAAGWVWSVLAERDPASFDRLPHWTTARCWLIRVGYYKLTRPKRRASDWIWIVDHSVQAGRLKCLAILGIRLADLPPPGRHLTLRDLEPIGLVPMAVSKGETVLAELERHVAATGVPRGILSDHGADLWAGIQRFRDRHPGVRPIYDVAHRAACLLKEMLDAHPLWDAFSRQLAVAKRQMHQTETAFLAPVTQRARARYMNLAPLLDWAAVIFWALDERPAEVLRGCRVERLEAKLGWLREYREAVVQWQTWRRIAEAGVRTIRDDGLTVDTPRRLADRLTPLAGDASGQRLAERLVEFGREQTAGLQPGERLPGSSEVIESCFGKQKSLSGDQSQGGFTALLLAMGALAGPLDEELVGEALEATPGKLVHQWCAEHLGATPQSQRQTVYAAFRKAHENAEDPKPPSS